MYLLVGVSKHHPPATIYRLPDLVTLHITYSRETPPHPLPGAEKTAERLMLEPESV